MTAAPTGADDLSVVVHRTRTPPKPIPETGDLQGRKVEPAPVTHWSEKVSWVAFGVLVAAAAVGAVIWAVPSLTPAISYTLYVGVPLAGAAAVTEGIAAGYLKKFVPQKALEESIQAAEGITLSARDVVKKLRELESTLAQKNQALEQLTEERRVLQASFDESVSRLEGDVRTVRTQNELLAAHVTALEQQISSLTQGNKTLAAEVAKFKQENATLGATLARAQQLAVDAREQISHFGIGVAGLDTADNDIAAQVAQLKEQIGLLLSAHQRQQEALATVTAAKDAAIEQKRFVVEKFEQLERGKIAVQTQVELLEATNKLLMERLSAMASVTSDVSAGAKFFDEHDDALVGTALQLERAEGSLREMLVRQQAMIQQRDAVIDDLKKQLVAVQQSSVAVHQEAVEAQRVLESLDRQEEKFLREIDKLKEQLLSLQALKTAKEQEVSALSDQVLELKTSIEGLQKVNASIESSIKLMVAKLQTGGDA